MAHLTDAFRNITLALRENELVGRRWQMKVKRQSIILWFVIKNTYWSLFPVPGTEFLKFLKFPGIWETLLFSSSDSGWAPVWLSGGGLVTGKTKPWLEVQNFQPHSSYPSAHPTFSWEGRRAENEINNQSCLHDEVSMKFWKDKVPRASRWVNTSTSEGWYTPNPQEQKHLHSGPSKTSPGCSSISFIISFN